MNLPEPITMLESIEHIKVLYWEIVAELFQDWDYPYNKQIEAWMRAFEEHEHVVGREQAVKDYYGNQRTKNRQ